MSVLPLGGGVCQPLGQFLQSDLLVGRESDGGGVEEFADGDASRTLREGEKRRGEGEGRLKGDKKEREDKGIERV